MDRRRLRISDPFLESDQTEYQPLPTRLNQDLTLKPSVDRSPSLHTVTLMSGYSNEVDFTRHRESTVELSGHIGLKIHSDVLVCGNEFLLGVCRNHLLLTIHPSGNPNREKREGIHNELLSRYIEASE